MSHESYMSFLIKIEGLEQNGHHHENQREKIRRTVWSNQFFDCVFTFNSVLMFSQAFGYS